jgi:hypothetical protein
MSRIISLSRAILDFEQHVKESIGAAWARFLALRHAGLNLYLPDSILLWLFCLGIDMEADLCLDMTAGGRFTHKTMTKQVEFVEHHRQTHFFHYKNQISLGESHVECWGFLISRIQTHAIIIFDSWALIRITNTEETSNSSFGVPYQIRGLIMAIPRISHGTKST